MTDETSEDWAKRQSDEEPLPDEEQTQPAEDAEDDAEEQGDTPPAYRKRQSHAAWWFVKMSGDKCRYNHSTRKWYLWQGDYWREDKDDGITRLWLNTLNRRYAAALKAPDTERPLLIADITSAGATSQAVDAGLKLARSAFPIKTSEEDWNNEPYLIACTNGVYDIEHDKFRRGKPEDMISLCTNVEYDVNATCPRWDNFLTEVFPEDFDLQGWISEFCGAALVGTKKEHLLVNHGKRANNGKSKFIYGLMAATGDLSTTLPVESLMNAQRKAGGTTNDLMVLRGARFVFTNEPDRGARLKGGVLKRMVSVDRMSGRPNYGPQVEWSPTHSIILSTNTLPVIDDSDNGVWDRVVVAPWNVRFHEKGMDDDDEETGPDAQNPEALEAELRREAPGILNWLIRNAVDYVKKPTLTSLPETAKQATKDYRQNEDTLAPFIAACLIYDKDNEITVGALRKAYADWCEAENIPPRERQGPKALAPAVEDRGHGVRKYTNKSNITCLSGIRLRGFSDNTPPGNEESSNGKAPGDTWWERTEQAEETAAR